MGFLAALISLFGDLLNMGAQERIAERTNQTNKQIADDTNAANERMNQLTNETNAANVAATNEANIQIAESTNQANRDIAYDTNKTNRDIADATNELQRQLAEQEYQRSTATNQIAELQRAGYSSQQAKMLVAGNFSPATYNAPNMQMATMTPGAPMVGAEMQAAQATPGHNDPWTAVGAQLNGIDSGAIVNAMLSSYESPDGGLLGIASANPITSELASHFGELSDDGDLSLSDYSSPANLAIAAQRDNAPDWLKELVDSPKFKRMQRSLPGQRAYRSWFRDNNAFRTWQQDFDMRKYQIEGSALDNSLKSIDLNQIKPIQIESAQYENMLREFDVYVADNTKDFKINKERQESHMLNNSAEGSDLDLASKRLDFNSKQLLYDLTNRAAMEKLKASIQRDSLEFEQYSNPEYRSKYLDRILSEQISQEAIATYLYWKNNNVFDIKEKFPEFGHIVDIGQALEAGGITDKDIWVWCAERMNRGEDLNPVMLSLYLTSIKAAGVVGPLLKSFVK